MLISLVLRIFVPSTLGYHYFASAWWPQIMLFKFPNSPWNASSLITICSLSVNQEATLIPSLGKAPPVSSLNRSCMLNIDPFCHPFQLFLIANRKLHSLRPIFKLISTYYFNFSGEHAVPHVTRIASDHFRSLPETRGSTETFCGRLHSERRKKCLRPKSSIRYSVVSWNTYGFVEGLFSSDESAPNVLMTEIFQGSTLTSTLHLKTVGPK